MKKEHAKRSQEYKTVPLKVLMTLFLKKHLSMLRRNPRETNKEDFVSFITFH